MKYNPPGAQVSDDALAQKYLLYTPPSWQKRKIWVRKAGIHGRIFSLEDVFYHWTQKVSPCAHPGLDHNTMDVDDFLEA
jgi:hypothetical protein